MVRPQQPAQIYPLGLHESDTDRRFTFGLVLDVAEVLAKRGYPDIVAAGSGVDTLDLRQILFQFIYGDHGNSGRHTEGCAVWTSPAPGCNCGGDQR
jgi:hypothetical protein